jgi:hypothetical protein
LKTLLEKEDSSKVAVKNLSTLAAKNIQAKIPLSQIKLPLESVATINQRTNQVRDLVNQTHMVNDEQIIDVIEDEKILNIRNLVDANPDINTISQRVKFSNISATVNEVISRSEVFEFNQTVELTLDKLNINAKTMVEETQELQFIKAKICIEELRLKMTYESANRLVDKGIDVSIEPMEDVLEQLKAMEKEQYTSALKVHQVAVTETNLRHMEATMTAVSRLESISSFHKRS